MRRRAFKWRGGGETDDSDRAIFGKRSHAGGGVGVTR